MIFIFTSNNGDNNNNCKCKVSLCAGRRHPLVDANQTAAVKGIYWSAPLFLLFMNYAAD